jgi:ABC-type uncharacterized transport system substrate-binding protein
VLSTQFDLIVSVGMKASVAALAQSGTPVLTVMVPKAGYDELLAQPSSGKTSAIYLDQPWDRQLDFIRAVLPNHRKIGLLYSPLSHVELGYLKRKVAERGSTLIAESVSSSEDVFASLNNVLEKCEVLLAAPDNTIYNNSNIRNILLSSYRHETPFIGLSQSYVTAGALGAIFTTPQQLSDQVAATITSFAHTGELPKLQYPREFTISLNPKVASSLGIELPSTEVIRNRMNSANRSAP